jgi:hypothetical protein
MGFGAVDAICATWTWVGMRRASLSNAFPEPAFAP